METACSYCGKDSTAVGPMMKGLEDFHMCGPCLRIAKDLVGPKVFVMGKCAFCGRKLTSAEKYIEGPSGELVCFPCCIALPLP
jgi:hypothetical protein